MSISDNAWSDVITTNCRGVTYGIIESGNRAGLSVLDGGEWNDVALLDHFQPQSMADPQTVAMGGRLPDQAASVTVRFHSRESSDAMSNGRYWLLVVEDDLPTVGLAARFYNRQGAIVRAPSRLGAELLPAQDATPACAACDHTMWMREVLRGPSGRERSWLFCDYCGYETNARDSRLTGSSPTHREGSGSDAEQSPGPNPIIDWTRVLPIYGVLGWKAPCRLESVDLIDDREGDAREVVVSHGWGNPERGLVYVASGPLEAARAMFHDDEVLLAEWRNLALETAQRVDNQLDLASAFQRIGRLWRKRADVALVVDDERVTWPGIVADGVWAAVGAAGTSGSHRRVVVSARRVAPADLRLGAYRSMDAYLPGTPRQGPGGRGSEGPAS